MVAVHSDLSKYFDNEMFSDCTIISSQDKKFKVHRAILAKNDFFLNELKKEEESKLTVLNLPETDDILEDILFFIYSGRIKGSCKNMNQLLISAKKYLVSDLENQITLNELGSLCAENAVEVLIFAHEKSLQVLENEIIEFIANDFKGVMETAGWKLLDPSKYARLKDKIIDFYICFNERNIIESEMCEQQMET